PPTARRERVADEVRAEVPLPDERQNRGWTDRRHAGLLSAQKRRQHPRHSHNVPVKRRAVGRDPALVVRMLLALGLLAAFYAAIAVGVIALLWWQPGWLAYTAVIGGITVVAALTHLRGTESLVLRSARA